MTVKLYCSNDYSCTLAMTVELYFSNYRAAVL